MTPKAIQQELAQIRREHAKLSDAELITRIDALSAKALDYLDRRLTSLEHRVVEAKERHRAAQSR